MCLHVVSVYFRPPAVVSPSVWCVPVGCVCVFVPRTQVFRHPLLPMFPSVIIMDPSPPEKRVLQRLQSLDDVWILQVRRCTSARRRLACGVGLLHWSQLANRFLPPSSLGARLFLPCVSVRRWNCPTPSCTPTCRRAVCAHRAPPLTKPTSFGLACRWPPLPSFSSRKLRAHRTSPLSTPTPSAFIGACRVR
jgi:hypothetical protein